jgi:hypothetical protein
LDEVKLKVLTRGDMQHAVGVFLGEIGQRVHLSGIQAAERDLDALHPGRVPECIRAFGQIRGVFQFLGSNAIVAMPIVVTLAVGASPQTSFRKHLFIEFALLSQLDFRFKDADFVGELRIDLSG